MDGQQWVRRTQIIALSAWLIASCAKDGGPHPEVPAPDGGAGLGGGAGGAGGSDGGTDAEAGAGGLGGSGGGAAGVGGFAGMSMTGGVGGIGTGGMGTGGMSASESCTDSDATLGSSMDGTFSPAEALEKGTTNGTNGTFEDACDDRGDLIEHTCETHFGCGDGDQRGAGGSGFSTCAPRHQPTGRAIQHLVDCFGMCADGVCEVPCPAPNDPLTVTAADAILEEYELDPGIQGLRYVCSRMCDSPAPSVGDVLTVRSIAAPDDTRLDCRELFSDTANPLLLSDGCSYIGCSARRPSTP